MTAIKETERIADQLKRALEGPSWHGPSLLETLDGIEGATASFKPLRLAHSIWEIVMHVTAWEMVARRRISGETVELTPEQDWPARCEQSQSAWEAVLNGLREENARLRKAVLSLSDDELERTAPGCDYSIYVLAHGAVQHDIYHAGQIMLVRKAIDQARGTIR